MDFEKVYWEREITLPYSSNDASLLGVTVSNTQDIFLKFGTEVKNVMDWEWGIQTNYPIATRQSLFQFGPSGDLLELKIEYADAHLKSMALGVDETGDARFFGFIGPRVQNNKGEAFVAFTCKRGEQVPVNSQRRPIDDLYENVPMSKRMEFQVRDGYLKRDQGTVIMGEQFEVIAKDAAGPLGSGIPIFNYYHGAIAVVNMEEDNTIRWVKLIPKLQHNKDRQVRYSSYYSFPYRDKLLFFYNDNPVNVTQLEYQPRMDMSTASEVDKAVTIVATIDADGKLTKQRIPGLQASTGFTLVASEMVPIGENKLLAVARWRKDFKVGVITLND